MPRKPIPEELLTEKQKKDRRNREKNKKYAKNYSKYYYLKTILANPDHNQKFWQKQKQKKLKQSS